MDYCLPQDEYFEWEEIVGYNDPREMENVPRNLRYNSVSEYRTSTSQTLMEDPVESAIVDFQWSINGSGLHGGLSSFSTSTSIGTSTSVEGSCNSAESSSPIETIFDVVELCDTAEAELAGKYEVRTEGYVTIERTKDDISVVEHPTRNVDYLSHDWRETELLACWKHLASTRKQHEKIDRLENATWRSWAKIKYGLKTISPQTFNWYVWCLDHIEF